MAVDTDGNATTDALLNCYMRMTSGQVGFGPPHIAASRSYGYVLRADRVGADGQMRRILCASDGAESAPTTAHPLDTHTGAKPDAPNQRLIEGWKKRKSADAAMRGAASQRMVPVDAATVKLLEGVWHVPYQHEDFQCLTTGDTGTQYEFEFQRSGGRLLVFEPHDLFTPVALAGVDKLGDEITLLGRLRDGTVKPVMRLRPLPPVRLELLPMEDATTTRHEIAVRCAGSDPSVLAGITDDKLKAFLPNVTGGIAYPAAIAGLSDDDICRGDSHGAKVRWRSLQLELYGPAHYWVSAWEFWPERKIVFDFVRSAKDAGPNAIKLEMQQHLENGPGWDSEAARGKLYELTLIDRGNRIDVPELSTSFVRCKPLDPSSIGLHRW